MEEIRYRVLFSGNVAEGYDADKTKEKLAALFRVDMPCIDRIFNGRLVSIKKNVDYNTAQQYCNALGKIGAICRIAPMEEQQKAPPANQDSNQDTSSALGQTLIWVGDLFQNGSSSPDDSAQKD